MNIPANVHFIQQFLSSNRNVSREIFQGSVVSHNDNNVVRWQYIFFKVQLERQQVGIMHAELTSLVRLY